MEVYEDINVCEDKRKYFDNMFGIIITVEIIILLISIWMYTSSINKS